MKRLKQLLISSLILGGVFYCNQTWAEDHYIVGGATECGWTTDNMEFNRSSVAMVNVKDDIWVWAGTMKVGDGNDGAFKIPNSSGGWEGYWAPSANFVLTSGVEAKLSTNSEGDNKYHVAEAGMYRVTINTSDETIKADLLSEPTKDGDYYLISSVDDYYWFAGKVTSAESSTAKARLTTDLDFADTGFFPLACDKYKFKGEFDGAGHTISNATIIGSNNNVAFIRYATGGANIRNLIVEGSFAGYAKIGGIIAHLNDGGTVTMTNVINKASVRSTDDEGSYANAAAFVGCAESSTILLATNCANMGSVSGQDGQCAAFAGWTQTGTTFTNCWNSGTIQGMQGNQNLYRNSAVLDNCYDLSGNGSYTQGTKLAQSALSTADFCYKLNNSNSGGTDWYLTIGTDAHPYPFKGEAVHGTIYANEFLYCDGEPKPGTVLENDEKEPVRDAHHWNEWGFCDNSHDAIDCNELQPDFMTPVEGYYLIGTKQQLNWFAHKVNGYKSVAASYDINGKLTADIDFSDQAAMIGGDGNSVAYRGTFDGQGHKVTLGYAAYAHNAALFRTIANANIKNLVTDGTISNEGGNCAGGIFGGSHGASVVENCVSYVALSRDAGGDATFGGIGAYMHDTGKIKNCAFYGSITTPNATGNGGLLGYANGGGNIAVENCIVNAVSFTFSDNSVSVARNTGSVNNTYVVNAGSATQLEAETATAEQLASGELAFIINSESGNTIWHQTIGTDRHPYPFSGDHMVVSKDNDDYYNGSNLISIASGSELNTFATNYNNGMYAGACKVKLTSDLDMYDISYPGIGVDSHYFVGVLDGQGYIISNLSMKEINHDNIGFINAANAPSTIRNLTLDNSCSINVSVKQYVGGIMGACFGEGIVSFYNCGNEAAITANKNPGGILGCNLSGGVTIQMKNCYNTGAIEGEYDGSEGGGISGWLGNNSVLTNCYSTGSVTNGEAFARGNSATVTNCYTRVTSSGGNHVDANYTKTADEFADGTVFAKLFDYTNDDLAVNGNVWRMDYDAATPHPVLYGDAIAMREDCENRMVEGTYDLTLYRTIKQGGWNTFCVPFNMSSSQITEYFGADTEVAVLDESKNGSDDVLHFKLVDEIEAGQAYLVYPGVAADFSSKAIEGVTISATSPQDGITQAGFTFKGVYVPTELVPAEDRIVVSGNKIVKTTGGKLNGFRAYFKPTDANARATRFVIDDDNEVTGIITAEGEVIMDQPVYNLRGQRVQKGNSSSRGLLIKGGKKYVKM